MFKLSNWLCKHITWRQDAKNVDVDVAVIKSSTNNGWSIKIVKIKAIIFVRRRINQAVFQKEMWGEGERKSKASCILPLNPESTKLNLYYGYTLTCFTHTEWRRMDFVWRISNNERCMMHEDVCIICEDWRITKDASSWNGIKNQTLKTYKNEIHLLFGLKNEN